MDIRSAKSSKEWHDYIEWLDYDERIGLWYAIKSDELDDLVWEWNELLADKRTPLGKLSVLEKMKLACMIERRVGFKAICRWGFLAKNGTEQQFEDWYDSVGKYVEIDHYLGHLDEDRPGILNELAGKLGYLLYDVCATHQERQDRYD